MDAKTLVRLRPINDSASAIRVALDLIHAEREVTQQRLAEQTARRTTLLLSGTNAEIRAAEEAAREADTDLVRLGAMAEALAPQLVEAVAREAGDARAQQVRDATAKITAFNTWMANVYTEHGRAIAAGVELERLALRAIDGLRDPVTKSPTAELPPIARAFVRTDARGLGFLTRLPAAEAGAPIVWPQ